MAVVGNRALGAVAALPVDVTVAVAELKQDGFVEGGDAELRAPYGVVVEVALNDAGDDGRPIGRFQRKKGDAAAARADLIAPDRKYRFERDDAKTL
jgi:hypothetical protein